MLRNQSQRHAGHDKRASWRVTKRIGAPGEAGVDGGARPIVARSRPLANDAPAEAFLFPDALALRHRKEVRVARAPCGQCNQLARQGRRHWHAGDALSARCLLLLWWPRAEMMTVFSKG